jgi:hypothetical protein
MIKRWGSLLAVASTVCLFSAAPALAQDTHQNQNGKGHTSHGNGNGYGHSKGVPGPLAGVGLPFLLAAGAVGAYRAARRRRADAVSAREDVASA